MPRRTIGMLLGIPEADQVALREKIDASLRLEEGAAPDDIAKNMAAGIAQAEMFAEYLDYRVDHPSDDVMTQLLLVEFEDVDGGRRRFTREEVLNYINLVAAAGNETTTRLIGWMGKLLADHPDQRAEIVEDRSLVANTVEESLRFEAPSPVQARYVTTDVEIHGEVVPAGSSILLINGSGNRDDRKFPNGDAFDIHRSIDHHHSFGYGLHFCLGAALARLEGRVALDEVLQRFPEWEVDWDHAVQARTSTVRGWEKLPVKVP
jgi:cytochrome P450